MTMPRSARRFLALGALAALVAVLAGAFGAHALRGRLDPGSLAVFETGVRYQFYHAIGLLVIGCLSILGAPATRHARFLSAGGWCFALGIVLFSGSLYLLALAGFRALGIVTPFGGLAFVAGWGCLLLAVLTHPCADQSGSSR